MNTYPIGFNTVSVNTVPDKEYYLDVVKRLKASWQMEVSDAELGSKMKDQDGNTEVIHRSYGKGDAEFWNINSPYYKDPKVYARELTWLEDTRLWTYMSNEPNPKNIEEVKRCMHWHAESIDEHCGRLGRKTVTLNGGIWLEPEYIDAGAIDDVLWACATYPDKCRIGVHPYAAIFMIRTYMSIIYGIKDKENVQEKDWLLFLDSNDPSINYINRRIDWLPHLYRYGMIHDRAKALGISDKIRYVATEGGTDRLQDVDGENGVFEFWKNIAGVPYPYAAPHGLLANYKVYDYVWGPKTVSKHIMAQLKNLRMNYPTDIMEGYLLFNSGYDQEFEPRGFNLLEARELHELMIADSQEWYGQSAEAPDPEPEPDPIVVDSEEFDLLDYLMGDGHTYTTYSVFPEYTGVSHNQTDLDGRRFFHAKGVIVPWDEPATWEELWFDEHYVWRGTDISAGADEYYVIYRNPGLTEYGQRWLPRKLELGDSYYVEAWVQFYKKSDGQPVPGKRSYLFPHWIKFAQHYDKYTFENGVVLDDVIELHGILDDKTIFEKYWYARGYGLVAWENPKSPERNRMFFQSPAAPGRLRRKEIPSVYLMPQEQLPRSIEPYKEETMEAQIEGFDKEWTPIFIDVDLQYSFWSVRSDSNTSSTKLTQINRGEGRHALLNNTARIESDGTWYNIRLDKDDKWPGFEDLNVFGQNGWVRADGIYHPISVYEVSEPDPIPESEEHMARIYIPSGEHLTNSTIAIAIADVIGWVSSGLKFLQPAEDSVLAGAIEGLDFLEYLYRNWKTTMENAKGIIIYEVDDNGDVIPEDEGV